jgi:hypothetical protein
MDLCPFFDDVPRLRVRDPLAKLLGCSQGGVFEYGFADAVRLTGHSCPTVAAAYWLTCLSLARLYPNQLPERGRVFGEMWQRRVRQPLLDAAHDPAVYILRPVRRPQRPANSPAGSLVSATDTIHATVASAAIHAPSRSGRGTPGRRATMPSAM